MCYEEKLILFLECKKVKIMKMCYRVPDSKVMDGRIQ